MNYIVSSLHPAAITPALASLQQMYGLKIYCNLLLPIRCDLSGLNGQRK